MNTLQILTRLFIVMARKTTRAPGYEPRLQWMAFMTVIHELTEGDDS
uniref:Uncharacterized protein n=1 Tax=Lepeophtheirus salmonis TaxID=72036 RepID=A0A0K2T9W6_LEPSM